MNVSRNKMSNTKDQHQFNFKHIFSQTSTQIQIFQQVAKPVIDNCLLGYNGTIFTYGQTGSGKTFTMSGGQQWKTRGIIPRVLHYIFQKIKNSQQFNYSLNVSFIQIYNQNAYDLLDQMHTQENFQSWTKIVFMQDQQNNIQMKNVKTHYCQTQKDSIDYFMMGNYNKKVNSTALNQVSSRSHCIFTLNIKGVNKKTKDQVYSKIHLVDLAGSQRISKSLAEGIVLTEAKSINLSLSYLQQVIIALNQKSKSKIKQHIPYRNSLLTTLLKDSLGGNCKTVMIATISMTISNVDQTISTLRFSQRVKKIQNQVCRNQKNLYSNQLIALEKQNAILKNKLLKYQNQKKNIQDKQNKDPYIDQQRLRYQVTQFLQQQNKKFQFKSLKQANYVLFQIKDIYRRKMRQYASQLAFIIQKTSKYERILSKKQNIYKNAFN